MRHLMAIMTATVLAILAVGSIFAQAAPEFKLGFKLVADQIPGVVGAPLEDEHFNLTNGNSEQRTTTGLMVWRKADNWTAFTNGYMTWINGPFGIKSRLNAERFEWENDPVVVVSSPQPAATPIPSPAPTSLPSPTPGPAKTVSDGKLRLTINSVRTALDTGVSFGKADPGMKYVMVDVTVNNISAPTGFLSGSSFKVQTPDGRVYRDSFAVPSSISLKSMNLSAGQWTGGTVAFQIPQGASALTFLFEWWPGYPAMRLDLSV